MKKTILVLLGAASLLFFISCGSKPENEEATKPNAPSETTTVTPVESESTSEEVPVEEDTVPDETVEDLYNQALDAKQRIEDEDLASYDQKSYLAGIAALADFEILKADGASGKQKADKASEALAKFNTVINTAYKKFAKQEREEAYQAKKLADSVKAGVAEKDTYKQAAKDFQDGDSLLAMQAGEKAYNKYVSAKEVFTELYETVSEKRAAAAAALEAAKAKVAESANLANKADNTAPITEEEVDGIEEEDAVLLEEDDFEDPAEAEIDIPEDIDTGDDEEDPVNEMLNKIVDETENAFIDAK